MQFLFLKYLLEQMAEVMINKDLQEKLKALIQETIMEEKNRKNEEKEKQVTKTLQYKWD